ncbi:MAG: electron transfer flavoprotein subunit alpha/FixB family protein [Dehalococcoidia bacterium]
MNGPVVVCSWGTGAAGKGAEEILTLGRHAARSLGTDLAWLVLGPLPEAAQTHGARYGVARIDAIPDPALGGVEAGPDRLVEALTEYCVQELPEVVLVSQTQDARLVAARLAARLQTGVVMNAIALALGEDGAVEATAGAYGGDTRAVYAFDDARPCIVGVTPGAVDPESLAGPAAIPPVREVPVDLSDVTERVMVLEHTAAAGPRLEDARVIVAGGRGLGEAENFALVEQFASLLGGLPAASRAIVDDGWVGPALQVGLTGKITKPELYVAVGISGASQHMAGCSAAKAIVAINRDENAAIFRYARYGIVGDSKDVLSALIDAIEATAVVQRAG